MICEKDRYYEIYRSGKLEIAKCISAGWNITTFKFLDGDEEPLVITQDLIDDGFYKIIYSESFNTLML